MVANNSELNDRIRRFQALSLSFIHSDNKPTKRQVPAAIRNRVTEAAGEKCPLCPNILISTTPKKTPLDDRESTPDHILDLGLGGNNTVENFLILCHECNFAKNFAMQKQLTLEGIKLGSPGNSGWSKEFPSKSSNLTKLLEYIEWSFRIEEPSIETVFPELHGDFMGMRYGELLELPLSSEKTLQKTTETSVLSDLEKRIQALENTFWKRTMGAIGSFFQRAKAPIGAVEKSSIEKQAPQPQKRKPAKKQAPAKEKTPDFTAEEFVGGLLRNKTKVGEELFNNIYAGLIREEPRYNLKKYNIKPSSYLEDNCSELLLIEKKLHKNGKTSSLSISAKPSGGGDGAGGIGGGEDILTKFRQEVLAAFDESEEGVLGFPVIFDISRDIKKEFSLSWSQFLTEFGMNDRGTMNVKTKALLKASNIPHTLSRDSEAGIDYAHYKAQEDGTEEFRSIIIGIIAESDQKTPDGRPTLTISALGQRFSKKVQDLGFENKKEYFQQNGLDPTMSITKAISADFSEEIEFAGEDIWTGSEFKTNFTHVILNRRG